MTVSEVLALLNAERDERGISNWKKLGSGAAGLKSYGIGLTRLRKLAKKIGRNRKLAQALWATDVYDARVIALLIDDPSRITREQAEQQVEELAGGMLAHVFASCDATLAKTPFVVELADQWVRSDDPVRRDCGYGLLYEASKFSGKKAPTEAFFLRACRTHLRHDRGRSGKGPSRDGRGADGDRQADRDAQPGRAESGTGRGPDRVHVGQRRVRSVRRRQAPDHRSPEGEARHVVAGQSRPTPTTIDR